MYTGDEGRVSTRVSKGSDMGKGHTHTTMGETGKFEKLAFQKWNFPVVLIWTAILIVLKGGGEYRGMA